ncbi:MAG: ATP-dependent DNA helicase [Cyanobacteriota bacterium]|nr:ATP-dependent DNA helicase [Cyanobacteriota bacterium]
MIEVEVHKSLRNILRSRTEPSWPHHLTMARLVARALRLGRSALIQTATYPCSREQRYELSYLMPLLMWEGPTILVAPATVQERLLRVDIPQLLEQNPDGSSIFPHKPIQTYPPTSEIKGLLLIAPQDWLADRLQGRQLPPGIPTVIDWADDLETLAREQLTVRLQQRDWNELIELYPAKAETIRQWRVELTRSLFQHPPNPYGCYLISPPEQQILKQLIETLNSLEDPGQRSQGNSPRQRVNSHQRRRNFWHQWSQEKQLRWAEIDRLQGSFTLYCAPLDLAPILAPIWSQQPVVLIGAALELEAKAPIYRMNLGLGELTCVKFSSDRLGGIIKLYLPRRLPMPNTPQFQPALLSQLRTLLSMSNFAAPGITVILVEDVPLKQRVGAILASEFGSRVRVEKTALDENGILVTGWKFWRDHQPLLGPPLLLIIATLPLPSLENPLVAGRVADYKQRGLDWFRLYLLPDALREVQRATATVRQSQGVVALLDSRVIHRSYGHQVLAALSPYARIDYLDTTWLT